MRAGIIMAFAVIMLLIYPSRIKANILDDVDNVFSNFDTYYQAPQKFEGPGTTFLSFGSFKTYIPRKNYQLINVTPPYLRPTCGGIDVFMGGFSFVNLDQYPAMLKGIMSSAAGYFFEMAIEQLCPTCHNILSVLRHASQLAQKFSLDSCAFGKQLGQMAADSNLFHEVVKKAKIDTGESFLKNLNQTLSDWNNADWTGTKAYVQQAKQKATSGNTTTYECGNPIFLGISRSMDKTNAKTLTEDIMAFVGIPIVACDAGTDPPRYRVVNYKGPAITHLETYIYSCKNNSGDKCVLPDSTRCGTGNIPYVKCNDDACMDVSYICKSYNGVLEDISTKLGNILIKINQRTVLNANEKAIFYYTPYLQELWKAVWTYPEAIRSFVITDFINGLGAEVFAYLYLKGYLERLYAKYGPFISAVNFEGNDANELKKRVLKTFSEVVTRANDLAKKYDREVGERIKVYASLET